MAKRNPPLNALRAFEAAARHQSFIKAAEELHVTPAAVSRQVRLLEDHFGVPLFARHAKGVALEPQARFYAAGLTQAFVQLASINDEFRSRHTSSTLTVRGYTTFLVKWLVPRLPEFQSQYPKISVRLASGGHSSAGQGEADVLIRYGRGRWPGFVAQGLFRDELVPVCAPALIAGGSTRARRSGPNRIAELPLLALEARRQDWADWFAQCGLTMPRTRPRSFEDLAVLLEFARRGLGVALAQRSYVVDDIANGALVVVCDEVLRRDLAYYAIATEERMARTKVATFMRWLATQSTLDAGLPASPRPSDKAQEN